MTRSHLKSTAAALACALLLGGCAVKQDPAPNTDISAPNYSDEASTTQSKESSGSSENGESSPDSSASSSSEYLTENDKELRLILSEILEGAQEVERIFRDVGDSGAKYPELSGNGVDYNGYFYEITEKTRTQPGGLLSVPQTRDELETLLRRYFTDRTIEYFMEWIHPGKFTTDINGNTVVINTDQYGNAALLDIDGKLYGRSSESYSFDALDDIKVEDANVLERSETSIMFHFYADYPENRIGVILYEDGSWKFDCFGGQGFIPEMPNPADYTAEDKELQAVLDELSPGLEIAGWDGYGVYGGDEYKFLFPGEDYEQDYTLMPVGKAKNEKIEYPQTIDELKSLFLEYFTQQCVDGYMTGVCKATMTENPDGTYTVVPEDEKSYRQFVEINGKIYVRTNYVGGSGTPVWSTAQITEKSGDRIKFSYVHSGLGDYYNAEGLIKYERGGWRMSYSSHHGFVLDDQE